MAEVTSDLIKVFLSIFIISISVTPKDAALLSSGDVDGDPNIVGGKYAKQDQFPYQVAIIARKHENTKNLTSVPNDDTPSNNTGTYICSGAILTEKFVLTAAHCFDNACSPSRICYNYDQLKEKIEKDGCDKYSDAFVRAGVVDFNDLNQHSRQDRDIKEVSVPAEYESSPGLKYCPENRNFVADIAIITLAEPFTLNIHVRPVNLARTRPADKKLCTVTGWGEHGVDDSNENILKTADLKYILNDQHPETPSYIHIARSGNGDAVCGGDSGGPLVCGKFLSGVVSWGSSRCPQSVNVFTDVVYYSPWLAKFGLYSDF